MPRLSVRALAPVVLLSGLALPLAASVTAQAFPAQHQGRAHVASFSAHGSLSPHHRREPLRLRYRDRALFKGAYLGSVLPFYGVRQTIIVAPAQPAPRDVTVTVNRFPVVMGIRRPPEAQPVLYRIDPPIRSVRQLPSAGIRQVADESGGARIVVVRTR